MTGMAGEALTAAAIEPIARIGGLVAGRVGAHRPTLPRTPHDVADSTDETELSLDVVHHWSPGPGKLIPRNPMRRSPRLVRFVPHQLDVKVFGAAVQEPPHPARLEPAQTRKDRVIEADIVAVAGAHARTVAGGESGVKALKQGFVRARIWKGIIPVGTIIRCDLRSLMGTYQQGPGGSQSEVVFRGTEPPMRVPPGPVSIRSVPSNLSIQSWMFWSHSQMGHGGAKALAIVQAWQAKRWRPRQSK